MGVLFILLASYNGKYIETDDGIMAQTHNNWCFDRDDGSECLCGR
jgi:hypothetical protein